MPPGYQQVLPADEGYVLIGQQANPGKPGEDRSQHIRIARWDGSGVPVPIFRFDEDVNSIGTSRGGASVLWHRRDPAALVELVLEEGAQPEVVADLSGLSLRDLRIHPVDGRVALLDSEQRLVVASLDQDLVAAMAAAADRAPVGWHPKDWLVGPDALIATDSDGRVALLSVDELRPEVVAQGVVYASVMDDNRLILTHSGGTDLLQIDTGRRLRLVDQPASVYPTGDGTRFVVRQLLSTQALYRATLKDRSR